MFHFFTLYIPHDRKTKNSCWPLRHNFLCQIYFCLKFVNGQRVWQIWGGKKLNWVNWEMLKLLLCRLEKEFPPANAMRSSRGRELERSQSPENIWNATSPVNVTRVKISQNVAKPRTNWRDIKVLSDAIKSSIYNHGKVSNQEYQQIAKYHKNT